MEASPADAKEEVHRLYNDVMKNLAASVGVARLAWISIYDQVDGAIVDDVRYWRAAADPVGVRAWMSEPADPPARTQLGLSRVLIRGRPRVRP